MRVWGLRFGVSGLGLRVEDLGFRFKGVEFGIRVSDLGLRSWGC